MSRIASTFENLDRPALVTFITAGDPDYATSLAALKALPNAGADIIELGMPFSDPMADGTAIQAANSRALANGASMKQTLKMVQEFRAENTHTPLVLMGYINPVFAYGIEQFTQDAAQAGVDGLIIVDLPPEEDEELRTATQKHNLDLIRLITPTTDETRLPKLLEGASGFLYYVSITGITGAGKASPQNLKPHLDQIRVHTDLPIAVGFGIKTAGDVAAMGQIADAVVVGSAIVQTVAEQTKATDVHSVTEQVQSLAKALRT